MKGMIYTYLRLNTKFWLGTLAMLAGAFIIGAAAVWTNAFDGNYAGMLLMLSVAAPFILTEPLCRDIERNIKSGFAGYTLCAGVSNHQYVLAYLVLSLLSVAAGVVLAALYMLIFSFFTGAVIWEGFFAAVLVVVIANALEFSLAPLTIAFRSAEKAGLMVGIIIGFGVLMLVVANNADMKAVLDFLLNTLLAPNVLTVAACGGITAVMYAVGYFGSFSMVRRGQIC